MVLFVTQNCGFSRKSLFDDQSCTNKQQWLDARSKMHLFLEDRLNAH